MTDDEFIARLRKRHHLDNLDATAVTWIREYGRNHGTSREAERAIERYLKKRGY